MITAVECIKLWVSQMLFWSSGAVFASTMEKRSNFRKRLLVFGIVIVIYTIILQYLLLNEKQHIARIAVITNIFLMVGWIYSSWKVSITTAIYDSIWAIVLWQLLDEVWSVIEVMGASYFAVYPYMSILGILVLYSINYLIVGYTIGKWMPIDRKYYIGPRQTISAVLLFLIIEVLAASDELRYISEYTSEWKFLYLSQMLCIVLLYLQNEMFKKSAMREELAIMNLLWKNKQEQYELSKENIELINQKSHDLKHQVRALRKLNKEEFDQFLNEMEESVQIYESIVKTGNDVLDTILTEKSLYCRKREIMVTCVADGSQMDFIDAIDLYAILGNALDNAIEAVEKFEEPDKRQIDVTIHRQKNFLLMSFMNPVKEKLVYEENEFPVTTKGDKKFHGFGLRSIFHFVKKYEGYMNVSEEDGCFSLKIMIPIP